jgi:exodeoxyribonuclease V alpha subunit
MLVMPATFNSINKWMRDISDTLPVVVLTLFPQHYLLISRNPDYTGITRAKKLAILVGPTKAIGMSIKRVTDQKRYTALAHRLRSVSAVSHK